MPASVLPSWLLPTALLLATAACTDKPAPQSAPAAAPAAPAASTTTPATTAAPDTAMARQPLTLAQLPAALRPTGKLLEAWRWQDANGANVLVASRTVVSAAKEVEDGRTARLLVRQYVQRDGSYQQLWQLQDDITECPVDLTLGLLPGSTRVTDLDGNGRTETTLVYALACRGGVDPADLKLILHEGAAKYALRGTALEMKGGPDEVVRANRQAAGPTCCATSTAPDSAYWRNYGLYTTEKDFVNAPPAFLPFAQKLWRSYRTRADEGTQAE